MKYLIIWKRIVKWFNGKKTIIGLIMTNLLQLDLEVYATMNSDLYKLLMFIAVGLAAGGFGHKLAKEIKKSK